MFYTIYKITNNLNGKYYIGKHQTKDLNDGYMGSGKLIKLAIDKHGRSNFTKEILHVFDNESEMNAKEKELVVISEQSYNLCEGGKGGWGYLNREIHTFESRSKAGKIGGKLGGGKNSSFNVYNFTDQGKQHLQDLHVKCQKYWLQHKHTEISKQKISHGMKNKQDGFLNSQFGTMWITDGTTNRKIKKLDSIPDGWYKGRV